jgi:hypothetical protein
MHSVCVVDLHVTINYIQILSVAQQYFYSKFMSLATIMRTEGLHVKCPMLH